MELYKNHKTSCSFKDLECWQKAQEFVKSVYNITKQFPEDERYGLSSQFRRAAVSIAANICEGYPKLSRAEKLWFNFNSLFVKYNSHFNSLFVKYNSLFEKI